MLPLQWELFSQIFITLYELYIVSAVKLLKIHKSSGSIAFVCNIFPDSNPNTVFVKQGQNANGKAKLQLIDMQEHETIIGEQMALTLFLM